VALAAIVTTLVGGLSVRGAPPNALLKVTARLPDNKDGHWYILTIVHEGGDALVVKDLQVMDNNSVTTMNTYPFPDNRTLFLVGDNAQLTCSYTGNVTNRQVSVYIIDKPSKQKIFSAKYVTVN
jgi:hypothetical protein